MYDLISTYNATTGQFGLANTPEARAAYLREAEYRNTDWFDGLFSNDIMQNHSVSISTGTEKAQTYASISAMYDPGWTKQSKVNRYTINLNTSYKLKKWLTANNNIDLDKTVNMILKDIRSNKIGRISFEDASE